MKFVFELDGSLLTEERYKELKLNDAFVVYESLKTSVEIEASALDCAVSLYRYSIVNSCNSNIVDLMRVMSAPMNIQYNQARAAINLAELYDDILDSIVDECYYLDVEDDITHVYVCRKKSKHKH